MTPTVPALVVIGLLLSEFAHANPPAATPDGASAPPFQLVTDNHQMMQWIIDPAADVIWDSAGTIITAQGSEELAPTTDAGWRKVQRAAATLAEAGNLLMLPGRAMGDDWIAYARQLVDTGTMALQAAEARDAEALFDAGGRIYQACRGCHDQYWNTADGN